MNLGQLQRLPFALPLSPNSISKHLHTAAQIYLKISLSLLPVGEGSPKAESI